VSSLFLEDAYQNGFSNGPLARAEVREGFGKHQIAILDYLIPQSFSLLSPHETPLRFTWGITPKGLRTFYGYVNHHEVRDDIAVGEAFIRFYCIGTSKPLNDPDPFSWRGVTASYIARVVAEKHGLRAVVHNSKTILPYATGAQGSDFDMLRILADDAGFKFWVDGSTLFFLDPNLLVTAPDRPVAQYVQDRLVTDTLIGVRSVDGSLAPLSDAPRVQKVYGLNDTGRVIRATSTQQIAERGLAVPGGTRVYPKSVSSLAEAHRVNDIAATVGTWSSLQAQTMGDGVARVGGQVSLAGNALDPRYSGNWIASGITHVLIPDERSRKWTYTAQLDLVRNQSSKSYFSSSTTLKGAMTDVPAVLRSARWEAEVLEQVYV
jgi:hypothetical protein